MMKPNRYGSLRRILLCIGMAIGSTLMPAAVVQAGTVNSLTVTSNGPWSVGQNNAQYTITLAHTRGGNNTVTLNDQLPAGLWPTWSGTRTTGSGGSGSGSSAFGCTNDFDNMTKRYAVACTNNNTQGGTITLTFPVWVDQLSVGTVSNAVSATASGGNITSSTHSTTVGSVQSVAWTQSCTALGGSLGSNRFANNGTFGTIASNTVGNATAVNSSSQLPAGATTMNYNDGNLADGDYRVSNRASKLPTARDNNWYWTVGDHTSLASNGGKGDPNHLMMVMNASYDPGIFYQETLTVSQHTTYEFSLWSIHANNLNFYSPLPMNIVLAVDRIGVDDDNDGITDEPGEEQVISSSGNIAGTNVPIWRQTGALFNSGNATQIRFIFRNNGPGGGGNDLAIDDVMLGQCSGLPSGSVRGTLYYDDNRNNSLDGAETGRLPAGVSVELRDANGLVVATTLTDANGAYQFLGVPVVPNANYSVRVVTSDTDIPAGAVLGTANNVAVTLTQGGTAIVNFGFDAIRLTLRKQWTGAAINDAVTISAQSGGTTLRSFSAVANSADELDVDATPVFLVAGTTVTISEAFTTGVAAQYQSQLACTGATDTDPSNGLQVVAADAVIVCTYTNSRRYADLSITKTNNASVLLSGTTTTYTIVVSNAGPQAANGAVLRDPAPTGMTCSAVSCAGATSGAVCPAVSVAALQSPAGVTINTLPSGSSLTFTLTCAIP